MYKLPGPWYFVTAIQMDYDRPEYLCLAQKHLVMELGVLSVLHKVTDVGSCGGAKEDDT